MLIEETEISGDYPVLVRLAKGDQKVMRLQINGRMLPDIRIGRVKVPSMFSVLLF